MVLVAAAPPAEARAQRPKPLVDVAINGPSALTDGPAVTTLNVLADPATREYLLNGFPTRIHYRLELWRRTGLFNDLSDHTEWDVLVTYDPTRQVFRMFRRTADELLRENMGDFGSLTSADIALAKPFRAPLHPGRAGQFYYRLVVNVQAISQSDLDALQQWLRGPSAPGKTSNPLTVLRSGLGTLFSRMLSGSVDTYQTETGTFTVP